MNAEIPPEWHRLFNAALNEQLDDAGREQLAAVLKGSADARQLWYVYQDNECSLAELSPRHPAAEASGGGVSWLRGRPLTAAAAGIVAGMLGTTAVFGFVKPRIMNAVTLLRESFESEAISRVRGFPTTVEVWGGDAAGVVAGEGTVEARDGERMMRLEPTTTDLWNRQYFLIDLSKLPAVSEERSRVVRVSASFHASASEIRDRYLARAATFAEGADAITPGWMTTLWGAEENRALTMAAKAQTFAPGTQGWQTLRLTLDVPPESRVLVISFWAATMHGQADLRAAHFLDDVRVSLETLSPTPP